MTQRILIVLGHPDPGPTFCRSLAAAYSEGARTAGHELRQVDLATLDFPWLRSKAAFADGEPPPAIAAAQQDLEWAGHVLLVYPLWLGGMPALLKAFLEQVLRPGFAHEVAAGGFPKGRLKGRSARIVVTMGMPAVAYRWFFRAHGLKMLKRNILGFCGLGPIRDTVIGGIEAADTGTRQRWLEKVRALGREAA